MPLLCCHPMPLLHCKVGVIAAASVVGCALLLASVGAGVAVARRRRQQTFDISDAEKLDGGGGKVCDAMCGMCDVRCATQPHSHFSLTVLTSCSPPSCSSYTPHTSSHTSVSLASFPLSHPLAPPSFSGRQARPEKRGQLAKHNHPHPYRPSLFILCPLNLPPTPHHDQHFGVKPSQAPPRLCPNLHTSTLPSK